MADYANIVLDLFGACINAVVTLFDRLGAIEYMLGAVAFIAVMRYMLLPLLDFGSAITSPRDLPDLTVPYSHFERLPESRQLNSGTVFPMLGPGRGNPDGGA